MAVLFFNALRNADGMELLNEFPTSLRYLKEISATIESKINKSSFFSAIELQDE